MNDPSQIPAHKVASLADTVGAKGARKVRARRDTGKSPWSGLAMMGMVGWSVTVPTLLGAALGLWLDKRHPGGRSWTLALLAAGLTIGCLNAWHWVAREDAAMHEDPERDRE